MTIEITSPDLEALIRQRMQAGAFNTPEDLIREALRHSPPDTRTGIALIEGHAGGSGICAEFSSYRAKVAGIAPRREFSAMAKGWQGTVNRQADGNLMSVSVRLSAEAVELGTPVVVFKTPTPLGPHTHNYDVSADGQRILTLAPASPGNAVPLMVLIPWQAGLKD